MDWRFNSYLVIGILAVALKSTSALSYPTPIDFDGALMRWDVSVADGPITYFIEDEDGEVASGFADLIDLAASEWNSVTTSYFRLARTDDANSAQITITLETGLTNAPAAAGYTTFDEFDDLTPVHCAIHLDKGNGVASYAFAKTALHEFGHCAGLGHSLIPEAIMSYSLDKNSFALDTDDIAAVSRIYPVDGSKPHLPPGCAVTTATRARWPMQIWLILALLLPLTIASRNALRGRHRP